MSSQVLLYTGRGAGPFCTYALHNQLANLLDKRFHQVTEINTFANCPQDPSSISAIFIPGGNAAGMLTNITEDAKSSLQNLFNKHHCSYYGACAGGIFAAKGCLETVSTNGANIRCIKIIPYPLLEIFPGTVIAPLFPKPQQGKLLINDFHLLNIQLADGSHQTLSSAHILSPGYLDVSTLKGAEILSTYETPFSIKFAAEKGKAPLDIAPERFCESVFYERDASRMVLTGSHPEVDSQAVLSEKFKEAFSATNQEQGQIAEKMKIYDVSRKALLEQNFKRIGLHCQG